MNQKIDLVVVEKEQVFEMQILQHQCNEYEIGSFQFVVACEQFHNTNYKEQEKCTFSQ